MQTILPPSGNTIKILGKARPAEQGLRWMHYILAEPVKAGVLVFHTLTRALAAAHAGGVYRAGYSGRTAQQLVSRTAGDG